MIISAANQKGGVGKTSSIYALGEILAGGYKKEVLLVDCDAQASLTHAANLKPKKTLADVLEGESLGNAVIELSDRLAILPSSVKLADVEHDLHNARGRTARLKEALEPATKVADYILLDLPPSLSLLTVNGLTASSAVYIPSRPTMLDVAGIGHLLNTVEDVKALNPKLKVAGVLFTFFDPRIVSMAGIIKELEKQKLHIFKTRIGQSVRVAEAKGKSVVTFSPSNPRSLEFVQFAAELLKEIK